MFDDRYAFDVYRPRTAAGSSSVVVFLVFIIILAVAFGFVVAQSQWLNPLLYSNLDKCKTELGQAHSTIIGLQTKNKELQERIHQLEAPQSQQTTPSWLLSGAVMLAMSLFAVAAALLYRTLRMLLQPPPRQTARTRRPIARVKSADAGGQLPEADRNEVEQADSLLRFHH